MKLSLCSSMETMVII